jgi:hypothetical protein
LSDAKHGGSLACVSSFLWSFFFRNLTHQYEVSLQRSGILQFLWVSVVFDSERLDVHVLMVVTIVDEGRRDLDEDISTVWARQKVVVVIRVQRSWVATEYGNDEESNPPHYVCAGARIPLKHSILETSDRMVAAVSYGACSHECCVGIDSEKIMEAVV